MVKQTASHLAILARIGQPKAPPSPVVRTHVPFVRGLELDTVTSKGRVRCGADADKLRCPDCGVSISFEYHSRGYICDGCADAAEGARRVE